MKMWLWVFGALILSGGIFSILLYASTVELRYQVSIEHERAQQLEIENTEFKNQLYVLKDSLRDEEIALGLGLVLDRNPIYLEISSIEKNRFVTQL